jgi:hypothetical protein
VIEALRRLHRWAEGKLATRGARIAASVLALALVAALAWPALSAAQSLAAQRSGILEALGRCSAAERDPSAMQLLERRTVSANGRTYGGPRVVVRPLDLFDEEGAMPASVRDDLSWRLLGDQVPPWLPTALAREPALIVTVALAVLAALLAVTWLGLLLPAIEVGVPVIALGALLWSVGLVAPAQWLACCALGLLLHAFLWRGLRGLLSARRGPVAVASNTVLEGVRTLAAPGFALPAAALLPMLALARGPEDPLYQAIPGFLDWGHTAVFALAAVFVLFFGCATTAFEIRDRQVWSVVTKPVSPAGWMLGKWLGTLALGTAAIVAGTLMLGAGAAYLASQRPVDEQDAADVRNAVLVARAGTKPVYEGLPPDRLREIVDQAIEASPRPSRRSSSSSSGRSARETAASSGSPASATRSAAGCRWRCATSSTAAATTSTSASRRCSSTRRARAPARGRPASGRPATRTRCASTRSSSTTTARSACASGTPPSTRPRNSRFPTSSPCSCSRIRSRSW